MEGAFFVGRTELLEWVNGLLQVNLSKVEQCASGAIYCQVVDACSPGSVKMSKVNWMARADHEYIPNYKLLQASFDKNNIDKHIDVDKLIRAKYQDNLEFLQWMKAMWEREGSGIREYDPVASRGGRPVPAWAKSVVPLGSVLRADSNLSEKENVSANREQIGADKKFAPKRRPAPPTTAIAKAAAQRTTTPKTGPRPGVAAAATSLAEEDMKLKLADQADELEELRGTLEGLENERDYYFGKLRSVEILCTTLQAKMDPSLDAAGVLENVLGILYAENDAEEDDNSVRVVAEMPECQRCQVPELPSFSDEQGIETGAQEPLVA